MTTEIERVAAGLNKLRCFIGRHAWRRCRFVALGTPPGEYDVQCSRCHKVKALRAHLEKANV